MYSIVDIECNGAGFRKENIIEIAIYKYDGHEIVDRFISLVNPQSEITPFVQRLTKISPKMVKTAPKFHEIAKRIIEITNNTTLVGHNIDFDYRMLRQEFKRLGYEFKINALDTIPLAKKLIPEAESYSLGKLVKSLGIPMSEQHRAGGDARATLDLFKLLKTKDENSEIIQQHFDEVNAKTYPNKIQDLTRDLPSEEGIIYFQNADGTILFSDFVDDLNKFAKKIFNSYQKRWKTIQEETVKTDYELTGNKIIAKLMMKTKGIKKQESLKYGLYCKSEKYFVDKISQQKDENPLLKFRSFTQGLKAVRYIESNDTLKNVNHLLKQISLKNRDELWLSEGRTLGEKSFLILQNGKIASYGFYELHHQIQSLKKINKLKTDLKTSAADLENDLKLGLLCNDFEILPIPK